MIRPYCLPGIPKKYLMDTKETNRPVFVKNGEWYVLKEGNSHIRAFAEIYGKTVVDYGYKEEVVDRPFDDYKAEVSRWADIRV